jgi:NAD-dependent dihydropyrimidine dehydrogenase PreA subunit
MAVETLTRTKCDRCKSVIEETPNSGAGETREAKPIIYVEQKGHPPIKFEDLCQKCTDRVANLCTQMRLEKDDNKASSNGSSESKKDKKNKDKKGKGSGSEASPPAN